MATLEAIGSYVRTRVPKGGLLRSVAVLAGGSAAAQILSMAVAPIATRLYTPSDYGLAAVFSSVATTVVLVSSAQYELAIPLPEDDSSALHVLVLCLTLIVASAVACTAAIPVAGPWLLARTHSPELAGYLWLLPIAVVGGGSYQALSYWALRRRQYRRLAGTRLGQSASAGGVSVGVGLVHHGPLGVLLAGIASSSAGISSLSRDAVRTARRVRRVSGSELYRLARAYRRFPLFSAGAVILNNVGLVMPPVLLAALYTPQVAGLFSLAQRTVSIPMVLVGASVSQVFLGEAAQRLREVPDELPRLFHRVTRRLAMLSLAVMALGLTSPLLFPVVFGARWREAGIYAAALVIHSALQVVVSPVSTVPVILGRQDLQMVLSGVRAALVILSLWLPSALGASPTVAVVSYSAAMGGTCIVSWAVFARIVRSPRIRSDNDTRVRVAEDA